MNPGMAESHFQTECKEKNKVNGDVKDRNYISEIEIDSKNDRKANEMKDILKELDIKPNRKTVEIVSNYIYDHGGIQKFKENINKYKIESSQVSTPQSPLIKSDKKGGNYFIL